MWFRSPVLAWALVLLGVLASFRTAAVDVSDCALYPIAVEDSVFVNHEPGASISLRWHREGGFRFLSWAGATDTHTLARSLTPPGNSASYSNPERPGDNSLDSGDWVAVVPGAISATAVRQRLEALIGGVFRIVVSDGERGGGAYRQIRVARFAVVKLISVDHGGQARLVVEWLRDNDCDVRANNPPGFVRRIV
jgi:hypothetical protein